MSISLSPEANPPSRLAVAEGIPMANIATPPPTLAATLERAARDHPENGILYLDATGSCRTQLYPELLADASRILNGLRALGVRPGEAVIFQLEQPEDFIPAFWACELGGFLPAPASIAPTYEQPHGVLAKLFNAWKMLGSPVILAGAALAPRVSACFEREKMSGLRVAAIDGLRQSDPANSWHDAKPDDLALLLLTSGSTGLPKVVGQTQRNLVSWATSVAHACEFNAADISLNWMPLDHVGGLVMFHLRDVALGCRQLHAPTEAVLQRPLLWLDWIERYRATITWAPNFAFGLVNDNAAEIAGRKWDLSTMRFILNGGEAIVTKTARRFLEVLSPHGLPALSMRPAWGMSETCSGVTYSRRFTLASTHDSDPFTEVGEPIPGIELRIADQNDVPVAEGRTGRLHIRGISVTPGYYRNPDANLQSFTADGWFITGDLGVIRDGQLSITGREKDVIIINGLNFYSHEIESVVEEVDGVEVSFAAACAIRVPGEDTDRVAVFFSPEASRKENVGELIRAIRARVSKTAGLNPDYVLPLPKTAIPKTVIGKIQRSQLKEQFERGDFADLLRADQGAATENSAIPEWFFRPAWREVALPIAELPHGASILLFADSSGLADTLIKELLARGHPCVRVEPGSGFLQAGPNSFVVAPGSMADYGLLLEAIGRQPDVVVHAWGYGDGAAEPCSVADLEAAHDLGAQSVLGLLRALQKPGADERPMRLLVVASKSRMVHEADQIRYIKAPVLGLLRTIPHESSRLDSHHVDLEMDGTEANARRVWFELSGWDRIPESAWRGEKRLVPYLEQAKAKSAGADSPLKIHGCYLLSGGLGGIGQHVAAHLLRHFRARLLIVGRSPLAPRESWSKAAAGSGPESELVRACMRLEAQGGEFSYVTADVADVAALKAALERAEKSWGQQLDGIFHLAGLYREALLETETPEGLAAAMHPKGSGTWALHQLALARPGCLFINFSSLISQFGSLSTGAYAAANCFLDAFSYYQRQACGMNAYNYLWSSWTDTGMSRDATARDSLTSRGYLSVSPEQGVASLLHALREREPQLVIGIDPSHSAIRKYMHPDVAAAAVAERNARAGSDGSNGRVPPRNEMERRLASLWEELLGVKQIGVTDNFFELGGRSLLAAKMFARLFKTFGKKLPIPALFKAPTVEQLARMLVELPKSAAIKIRVLQPGEDGNAVFLVSEPGADGAAFEPMAKGLRPDQPCIALLPVAPNPSPPLTVATVAEILVEEIVTIAPKGPCIIGGLGFGAILAWETAARLEARGREVSRIVLLEPPPSAFFGRTGAGTTARVDLLRPAAVASGIFGRRAKRDANAALAVTKELSAERERFGDCQLGPVAGPVSVFGFAADADPWREISPAGISVQPMSNTGALHRALRADLDSAPSGGRDTSPAVYAAPRTELECKMARMWVEVLGVPRVGLGDNFFELGGRSLTAARLFARIDKELGRKLPLATLFAAPTLGGLIAKIGDVQEPTHCRALPIQTGGSRLPFFCIPGGGSDAIVFQDLARELGPDQPFYGLQAPGLDAVPIEGAFPSVEEVAADFIAVMQGIQPHGPYNIGGHCFGSLLAWEIARQLEARRIGVGLLALLDPTVSDVFSDDILGWDRISFHFRRFLRLPMGGKFRYFGKRVQNFSRTLVARRRISQSVDQAHSMHQRYTLGPYSGAVVVFLAEDSFRSNAPSRDPRRYYERMARERTRYITVGGDHDTMLHGPFVTGFARDLRACLSEVETATQPSSTATSAQ
jgi:acyl-CoA synthetase (AMP-forming)/AMP-acid ligase II/thioesterase domain-containing protein/acyl carrier protein/nucleoside-diphosphate-sugar epimerase